MSDFNAIKFDDQHKTINAVKKAAPKTVSAIDQALSGIFNIIGYPTNYVGEYARYSIQKLHSKLTEKLSDLPPDKVVAPPVHIAAPILEKCRFTADCEELHNMFASLLATAMDYDMQSLAHPAFIQIIENLSPFEAKILTSEHFGTGYRPMVSLRIQKIHNSSGPYSFTKHKLGDDYRLSLEGIPIIEHMVSYESLSSLSIDNLVVSSSITNNFHRLGLFDFPQGTHVSNVKPYEKITEALKNYISERSKVEKLPPDKEYAIVPEAFILTEFGKQFITACVR